MCNILVGQSGGPTAVINASLYGVISEAFSSNEIHTVYGMISGIEGFIQDKVCDLSKYFEHNSLELLKSTPASFLGSCRYRLPDDFTDQVYEQVFSGLDSLDIDIVFYIGGNDSMDTVSKLSKYAHLHNIDKRFIGIPKTIDNDLVLTDHTPGYASTAKHVATTIREIALDASVYEHPVVTIVELMGRHAGWVTAASALARTSYDANPMLIYLPEHEFDIFRFVEDVREALSKNNSVIVCVSEGIVDKDGKFICEYNSDAGRDIFGHKMLTGCGKVLEKVIKSDIGCKCRSIEINLLQRCSAILASKVDIDEAEGVGRFGVRAALEGATGKMVTIEVNRDSRDDGGSSYCVSFGLVDVDMVCNREKKFPREWIVDGKDVSREFVEYVKPLIQGESKVRFENGLPVYLRPVYR